jgi:hypothetical protein
VQRARPSDVFVQVENGRIVVRGPNAREHIFEPSGTQVTSLDRPNEAHLGRVRAGEVRPATEEEFNVFKSQFK